MRERIAIAAFAVSAVAVAWVGRAFAEMVLPSIALLLIAVALVVGASLPPIAVIARPLAYVKGGLAGASVAMSLLAGTIGGSFHIDEPLQPALWALGGVAVSGVALGTAGRRATSGET